MDYRIKDKSLAQEGYRRILWAQEEMRLLAYLKEDLHALQPFQGYHILSGLPVTPETAVYLLTLRALGARIMAVNSGSMSTQDDIAAALAICLQIPTYAEKGVSTQTIDERLDFGLSLHPDILLDDGGIFLNRWNAHSLHSGLFTSCIGAVEGTTSGVERAVTLKKRGLPYPIIDINSSPVKTRIDNRFGTGHSVALGIMFVSRKMMIGAKILVVGYGDVGFGTSYYFRNLGAHVMVCEKDHYRALEARMMGYEVLSLDDALPKADILITCTGVQQLISQQHVSLMKDGILLANAGHDNTEIDVEGLQQCCSHSVPVSEYMTLFLFNNKRVFLMCNGGVVNLAVNLGCSATVMDTSFSANLMGVMQLIELGKRRENKIYSLREEHDLYLAKMRLQIMNKANG